MEDFKNLRENPRDDEWQTLLADLGRNVGEITTALTAMQSALDRLGQIRLSASEPPDLSEQAVDEKNGDTAGLDVAPIELVPEAAMAQSATWTWPREDDALDHDAANGPAEEPLHAVDALAASASLESSQPSFGATKAAAHLDPPRGLEVPPASKPPLLDWSNAEPKPWMPIPPQSWVDQPSQPVSRQRPTSTQSQSPPPIPSRESAPGSWVDSTLPGSWPSAGFKAQDEAAAAANPDNSSAANVVPAEADDAREQVRRAVELARAELNGGPSSHSFDNDSGEGAGMSGGDQDPDAVREQVRHAVELARAELDEPGPGLRIESDQPADEAAEPSTDADAGNDQALGSVEVPRTEFAGPGPAAGLDSTASAHPLASDTAPQREAPAPLSPTAVTRQGGEADEHYGAIPTMVIESPNGRIELASVYEMLSQLECTATANLVNYLPHSVTVTLGELNLPDSDWIKIAVEAAFHRTCNLVVDGRRATIRLADSEARVA